MLTDAPPVKRFFTLHMKSGKVSLFETGGSAAISSRDFLKVQRATKWRGNERQKNKEPKNRKS